MIYEYYNQKSRFFCRNYYPYVKSVSRTRCKYYQFLIFCYHCYLYQSKLDYLNFTAILKFSKNHLNNIKMSYINLGMTTNLDTNYQITKMKIKLNRSKIAEIASSNSIRLFQRTSSTALVNISFY